MKKAQVGVIGLGVMGYGFAMNLEDHAFRVALANYEPETIDEVMAKHPDKNLVPAYSLEELVQQLETPRIIIMMVKAGEATDNTINRLVPLLDKEDILVNGGNTYFRESEELYDKLTDQGIRYIAMGVSGGEEGARYGAALMPGGSETGYQHAEAVLSALAANAPQDDDPCVAYMGSGGAGHFTKMVHNGIEYSDSQLIAEAYSLMRYYLNLPVDVIANYFSEWNQGELESYLIGITANILTKYDDETGLPMIDVILDRAKSKGTGKWASQTALDLKVPMTIVTEAVYARYVSDLKEERLLATKRLQGPTPHLNEDEVEEIVEEIRQALYFSKIMSYAQGFSVYAKANEAYDWQLDLHKIAKIFRAGCVIQAKLLDRIAKAYAKDDQLPNILLDDYFVGIANSYHQATRNVTAKAIQAGIPVQGFAAAINYYDAYRSEKVSANMVQAQRDYFGAHTFERTDKPGSYHYDWLENETK